MYDKGFSIRPPVISSISSSSPSSPSCFSACFSPPSFLSFFCLLFALLKVQGSNAIQITRIPMHLYDVYLCQPIGVFLFSCWCLTSCACESFSADSSTAPTAKRRQACTNSMRHHASSLATEKCIKLRARTVNPRPWRCGRGKKKPILYAAP